MISMILPASLSRFGEVMNHAMVSMIYYPIVRLITATNHLGAVSQQTSCFPSKIALGAR